MKNLLSVTALADLSGLARQTIYNRHFLRGDLPPAIKIGTRLLFDPVDVQAWIDAKKQAVPPPIPLVLPARRIGRPTKEESIQQRLAKEGGCGYGVN